MDVFEMGKLMAGTISSIGTTLLEENCKGVSSNEVINRIIKIMLDFNDKSQKLQSKEQE